MLRVVAGTCALFWLPIPLLCSLLCGADGVIQKHEAELLRAIADTLDCPIPPPEKSVARKTCVRVWRFCGVTYVK